MPSRTASRAQAKKVRVLGTEQYRNVRTGESEEFGVVLIEQSDADFSRIWLRHILQAIDEIGNAKMRILAYLLEKRDRQNNVVIETYKEIAEGSGTSLRTVVSTINELIKHDIVRQKPGTKGVLFINPNVIFQGETSNRLKVLLEYRKLTKTKKAKGGNGNVHA